MATIFESERILQAAVTGIPRIATTIAEIPAALRERAFAAVARSYQQTVRDLGHPEADAQIWISAVMLRLRSQVAERRKKLDLAGRRSQVLLNHETATGPDPGATSDDFLNAIAFRTKEMYNE